MTQTKRKMLPFKFELGDPRSCFNATFIVTGEA